MIAQVSATASRASRRAPETGPPGPRARGWAARLARIVLAIYLLPVLLVMLLVGGMGMAVLGVAAGVAKLAAPIRRALGNRGNDFPI